MKKPVKIILICAATVKEAEACFPEMHSWPKFKNYSWVRRGKFGKYKGILAITGVGMPMTFMRLLPLAIDHQPDLILNIGIAGAYKNRDKKKNLSRKKNLGRAKTLEIGDTVFAQSECFGDMGMENPQAQEFGFTALGAMSWVDDIYKKPLPLNSLVFKDNIGEQIKSGKIKIGKGCTVNTCTGTDGMGQLRQKLFQVDFESMEGAAVALIAKTLKIEVAEIRTISNWAAKREMLPHNIEIALANLARELHFILNGNYPEDNSKRHRLGHIVSKGDAE